MAPSREIKNRKAFFRYEILEKVEAGLVLNGSEVKSLREGKFNLSDSYARFDGDELFLVNCNIAEYRCAATFGHNPLRKRKLLLHRAELRKLARRMDEKGMTVVPLRCFFNDRGFAKVELGIGRGKQDHDKRQTLKARESDREMRRQMSKYS